MGGSTDVLAGRSFLVLEPEDEEPRTKDMQRTTVRLPQGVYRAVIKYCKEEHITKSAAIIRACRKVYGTEDTP